MRFLRADIYGFGKWVDQSFDFSQHPLTCFYGENEAGKSTLQQFFLYMLFGLPPRKLAEYKPKLSNKLGGMLVIETESVGKFTIERIGAELRCLLPDGRIEDEDWLQLQLHHLTRETYTSIYAFSALDLSAFQQMKAEELSDVLFSVGLTGATTIYEVEKKLAKQLGELFKKSGRKPLINEQLTMIEQIDRDLRQAREQEASYQNKIMTQQSLQTEITMLERQLQQDKATLLITEKHLQYMPQINDYHKTLEQLATYPDHIPFPEDGLHRYELLKEKLLPIRSELHIIRKNVEDYSEQIRMNQAALYDEKVYATGKQLLEQKGVEERRQYEQMELAQKIDQIDEGVQHQLRGTGLLAADVTEIDFAFHTEATWKQITDDEKELQLDSERLTEDFQLLEQKEAQLVKEEQRLNEESIAETTLADYKTKLSYLDHVDSTSQSTIWEKKRQQFTKWSMVAMGFVTIFALIFAFTLEQKLLYSFAVVFAVITLYQFMMLQQSRKHLQQMDRNARRVPSSMGKAEMVTIIREQEQIHAQRLVVVNELKQLAIQKMQWQERNRLFSLKENKWIDLVQSQRKEYPFLVEVEPSHWLELYHLIRRVQMELVEKGELVKRLETIKATSVQFKQKMDTVANQLSQHGESNLGKTPLSFTELEKMLVAYQKQMQSIEQYQQLVEEGQKRQAKLVEEERLLVEEMNVLFAYAQVADEEAFFQSASQVEEKQFLQRTLAKLDEHITLAFPPEERENVLQKDQHQHTLELEIKKLNEQISEHENRRLQLQREIAAMELAIKQLEVSEDFSELSHRYQLERDRFNELAEEWTILKVAQSALTQAKQTYRDKYLHDVIKLTTNYFSWMTNGRYERVYAPTHSLPFQVEAKSKIRYTVEELSKGTIDQLYVALRLAISKVMSEKLVVPLMIDDAFVHFDDSRAARTIELLQDIAKEQQVILFTCRREIANSLRTDQLISSVAI